MAVSLHCTYDRVIVFSQAAGQRLIYSLVHTGNLTSDQTAERLPSAAEYKENRKPWENFPLVQFPTTSYTTRFIPHFPAVLWNMGAVILLCKHIPVLIYWTHAW